MFKRIIATQARRVAYIISASIAGTVYCEESTDTNNTKQKVVGICDIPKNIKITGTDFNKLTGNALMYKYLARDMTHNGFTYKLGENIDTKYFTDNVCGSGLHFSDEQHIRDFCDYGVKIGIVKVPGDSFVICNHCVTCDDFGIIHDHAKCKASKLELIEIIEPTEPERFEKLNCPRPY